jgi:hypothetical protein
MFDWEAISGGQKQQQNAFSRKIVNNSRDFVTLITFYRKITIRSLLISINYILGTFPYLDVLHDYVGEDEHILRSHAAGEVGLGKFDAHLLDHQLKQRAF